MSAALAQTKSLRLAKWLLLGVFILAIVSAIVLLLGIAAMRIFGSVQLWEAWRLEHYWHLLLWRILLYSILVGFWLKVRPHVLSRPTSTPKRMIKIEVLAGLLITLLEISKAAVQMGWLS
ncbi:conserved membrane hypothetical protein [Pseudomonas sp. 8Z]|uniref:hypothetical protein n=1 Tax=Pseudomonas sp. 8Z TaxID=2653166 RepID=UPI0012F1ED5A|nr:hypothetical protein [Pseudomonas sp. 8Z]VXC22613.1 conserved membrane hypothetical protein [Pseudomonas sp. 8Z]